MYPVDRDRTKPRVCRSQGGKKDVGGEVGISADVSGKEDTRMFENHEQDSTASRVRNARSQIRDMIILRWQYKVKNMQSKRLPAVVDMAVWKKVTKGQPVRWDKEVERVWQEIGGNKDEALSIGESARYKTKVIRGMVRAVNLTSLYRQLS